MIKIYKKEKNGYVGYSIPVVLNIQWSDEESIKCWELVSSKLKNYVAANHPNINTGLHVLENINITKERPYDLIIHSGWIKQEVAYDSSNNIK